MKLKLDDDGHVVVQDNKAVYVDDDGKELAFDAAHLYSRVQDLTRENAKHREAKENAEKALKAFEGIEDADVARKAMETVKNIKDGELVAAGKVEEIKAAARKSAEDQVAAAAKATAEQLKELNAERDALSVALHQEKIGGGFARSKFISEKAVIPADLMQARFGSAFKVEDGKTVAYDGSGNKIFSRARPGDLADFDEALEVLVDNYPYKDHILKGTGGSGSGRDPGNGGPGGGAKTLTRQQFEALGHGDRAAKIKDGFKVID